MMETTPHACGVDDTARPSSLTNEHAFGVDDAPYPFPSPVPGLGHFNQALMGHSCQAPKRTLLRWLTVPEFQQAYREARRAAFSQSIARLQQGTSAAATTLIKLLVDPATPASVKARVADSIFNHAAKAIEIEDIEARVSALEAATGDGGR
jgi:hypothetical protein